MSDQLAEQSATVAAAAGQMVPAAAAAGRRATTRKRSGSGKANGHAAAATVADPNTRTIAITLPKDVVEWYDQQAASAPFEPSTQKYIAWQLREWMKAGQKQAEEEDRAMIQEAGEQ